MPTSAPTGRSQSEDMVASMRSSIASSSLKPFALMNFIPLSGIALCEAEIMTPRS